MRRALSFGRRPTRKTDDEQMPASTSVPQQQSPPQPAPQRVAMSSIGGNRVEAFRRSLSFSRGGKKKLPRDWKSAFDPADGRVYFFNTVTQEHTNEWPQPLPRGWRATRDAVTGDAYFWHKRTREVRWERPELAGTGDGAEALPTRTIPIPAESAADAAGDEEEEAPPPPPGAKSAGAGVPLSGARRILSFGRRPRKAAETDVKAGAALAAGAPAASASGEGDSTPVYSWDRRKLNVADYMFSGRSGETLIKVPGSIDGQRFIIEECEDCDIWLLDWSACVTIDLCRRCRIFIGPCESSVFLRDCEQIKLVAACQQFRTRTVAGLDALLLTVSQPSIEETSAARFGCFRMYYPELQQQMLRARLSPFNNRWNEPYNFTPHAGHVDFLPAGTTYTELLSPLSSACPDRLKPTEEPSVPLLCPIPYSHGADTAVEGERCFVLFMPRCALHALRWTRALLSSTSDAPLALLRSREYQNVRPDFCTSLLAHSGQRQSRASMASEASRGRLIGIELRGARCVSRLERLVAGWNSEVARGLAAAAYAASSPAETEHMAGIFFASPDSGTEHS